MLTLKHFSTYAIVVKENDPDSGIVSMGENEVTVQKQADAVYYAAALYAEDGRSWPMPRAKLRRMKKP